MNNPEDKFAHEAHSLRLLAREKEALRQRILAHGAAPQQARPSFLLSPFVRFVAAPLALVLLISVPVTYAAQVSGPGDLLYPLELLIVEPIEETLHFSAEAAVPYHTARLEERLEELQDTDALTQGDAEKLETLVENVEEHAKAITQALATTTDTEEKIKYLVKAKAIVEAHEEVLETFDSSTSDLASSSDEMAEAIEEASEEYANIEGETEISETITEILATLGTTTLATSTLQDIAEEIESGDLEEALFLTTELQIELLKQHYLEPDDTQGTSSPQT